jgi:hypothetical protein
MKRTINPTAYLDDFLQYYYRAALLEERNHRGGKTKTVGDPLQDNVTIYDTVHRKFAGFSNVLRDLHEMFKLKSRNMSDWLFIYGVHRMTGSGASFFPKSEGPQRHGYCNVIAPALGAAMKDDNGRNNYHEEFVEIIRNWKQPMFSSFGNQPPPFPKPPEEYDQGGRYFFCEVWPSFVELIMDELVTGEKRSIAEFTDWMLELNRTNGFKRFKFTYTAFVMDIADWHTQSIDAQSQCYYGANCCLALNAMYSEDNKSRSDRFYHEAMDDLIPRCSEIIGEDAAPMDVEDSLCDAVRWWNRFVPRRGYDHLTADQRETTSTVSQSEFAHFCSLT